MLVYSSQKVNKNVVIYRKLHFIVYKFEQCKIDQIDPILNSRKQKADLRDVENKNLFLSEGGW